MGPTERWLTTVKPLDVDTHLPYIQVRSSRTERAHSKHTSRALTRGRRCDFTLMVIYFLKTERSERCVAVRVEFMGLYEFPNCNYISIIYPYSRTGATRALRAEEQQQNRARHTQHLRVSSAGGEGWTELPVSYTVAGYGRIHLSIFGTVDCEGLLW